jgi:hypothetical protein
VVTWRWIAAALALSQLGAPIVADAVAGNFLESGATNESLITPAGYAFGLWGLITALSAATAVAVLRYGLGTWWEMSRGREVGLSRRGRTGRRYCRRTASDSRAGIARNARRFQ